jgi:microcystin degradation protein MlrC
MRNFEEGHLFFGEKIIEEYKDAFHEIGGIIEVLSKNPVEFIPIMYAEATPGGVIDTATSEELLSKLISELETKLPLDGLMVVPHGAAVSEISDDFDGHWLGLVRECLGKIPIIGTLDPHANISLKMTETVDAFVAYKTNPHIDQREVGRQAASMMLDTLAKKIKPLQKMLPSQVAISIEQQYTSSEPCLGLYRLANKLYREKGVLSISILLGFPYADVYDMGSAFLVITDNRPSLADTILVKLEHYLQKNHKLFLGEKFSIDNAITLAGKSVKPVLLLDMGDNVGGGSPGDSTFLLHALESKNNLNSFICINDPEAVQRIKDCVPDQIQELKIGAKTDRLHGTSLISEVRLKKIVNGKFFETAPRHGGQVNYNMGLTAIVETLNGTTIMLTSKRTPPFSLQQLLQFNIDPADFDVVVAKGVQAPIAAYSSACPTIFRVNTPGVTTADMKQFTYKKRKIPLFPFENLNIKS